MAIKKGDFVEIDYTARLADGAKECFDTTSADVAKKEDIHSQKTVYEPVIVVVGEGHVIKGLDANLEGKEVGKYTFVIKDIDAFGKKSAQLLKLVPAKLFSKENIRPYPGLQVNVDNEMGVIRSVSGGRIIVDFNHPLSSKDVEYEVEVKRIVEDTKEKIESLFKMIGIMADNIKVDGDNATILTKVMLPEQLTSPLVEDLKRLTNLKNITFEVSPQEKKEEVKAEKK